MGVVPPSSRTRVASMAPIAAALAAVSSVVVALVAAFRRVSVEGDSMRPAFEPGDRVLVVRVPAGWPLRPGWVVALADPRRPERLLLKRAVSVDAMTPAQVVVAGDNAAYSTDSRTFGPVPRRAVWGRAVYRYAPAERSGRIA